jgi:glycosyltransferase involved in cell wall biosynthesis
MMISWAICTHNEGEYIQSLLNQLVPYCVETGDEIVIVDDYSTDEYTQSILNLAEAVDDIKLVKHNLNGDFSAHKNFLIEQCTGDYIFQIDADETLHPNLLHHVHDIIGHNPEIDLFFIPRVNVVTGLTDEDIQRWGWQINEYGWVMFPDYQTRLFRNTPEIRWQNKVHERIAGYKTSAPFPDEEEWSLYHVKDINRQRAQNEFYSTL